MLCFLKDEISKALPTGTPVLLVIENAGKGARKISVTLDGTPIALKQEADFQGAHGLSYFEYLYEPEKHGREQHIVLKFEAESGHQDQHTYKTRHGMRTLQRIDPP